MKKIIVFLLTVAILFALCACGQTAAPAETVPVASEEPTVEPTQEPVPEPTPTPLTVTLYMGDSNAEHIIPVDCEMTELTAQGIADKLCELGVFSAPITVNSCEKGNVNVLKLDLGQDFATQVQSMGSAGEYIMVGSLVNSFLKAYSADGVNITVDGGTFETGHSIYDGTMIFFAD